LKKLSDESGGGKKKIISMLEIIKDSLEPLEFGPHMRKCNLGGSR